MISLIPRIQLLYFQIIYLFFNHLLSLLSIVLFQHCLMISITHSFHQ